MLYNRVAKWIANIITPSCHDYIKWERKNKWLRKAGMTIGKNVAIGQNFQCLAENNDNIFIDDFCTCGEWVKVWSFNKIRLGKFSMIAADVTLVNGGHDKNSFEPFSGPLIIGRGCWIGNGARIVGPIKIGDNVIVGAGAVVLKDIPDGAIVAGVPARIIGMRDLPDKVWHLGGAYFSPRTFVVVE